MIAYDGPACVIPQTPFVEEVGGQSISLRHKFLSLSEVRLVKYIVKARRDHMLVPHQDVISLSSPVVCTLIFFRVAQCAFFAVVFLTAAGVCCL